MVLTKSPTIISSPVSTIGIRSTFPLGNLENRAAYAPVSALLCLWGDYVPKHSPKA